MMTIRNWLFQKRIYELNQTAFFNCIIDYVWLIVFCICYLLDKASQKQRVFVRTINVVVLLYVSKKYRTLWLEVSSITYKTSTAALQQYRSIYLPVQIVVPGTYCCMYVPVRYKYYASSILLRKPQQTGQRTWNSSTHNVPYRTLNAWYTNFALNKWFVFYDLQYTSHGLDSSVSQVHEWNTIANSNLIYLDHNYYSYTRYQLTS